MHSNKDGESDSIESIVERDEYFISFLLKINLLTSVTIDSRDLWKVEHRVTRNARCIGRVNDRFHKRSAELCYARSGSLTE